MTKMDKKGKRFRLYIKNSIEGKVASTMFNKFGFQIELLIQLLSFWVLKLG